MNIIFMAKETVSSLAAIKYLLDKNIYVVYAVVRSKDKKLFEICKRNNITVVTEDELLSRYDDSFNIDYLFSFYWKLAKPATLRLAKFGSINFHPGPLPEARGSGYHAAILGNWGYWGVTAHYMDATFDTGSIITCKKFPLPADIVNRDLVHLTHIQLAKLFYEIIDRIIRGEELNSYIQAEGTYYSKRNMEYDKYILPSDDSQIISRKIRAFWNPPYSGAKIKIRDKEYTVIDEEMLRYIHNHTKPQKESEVNL